MRLIATRPLRHGHPGSKKPVHPDGREPWRNGWKPSSPGLRSSEVNRSHPDSDGGEGGCEGQTGTPPVRRLIRTRRRQADKSDRAAKPSLWPSSGRPANSGTENPPHCRANPLPWPRSQHHGAESTMPAPHFPETMAASNAADLGPPYTDENRRIAKYYMTPNGDAAYR